MYTRKYKSASRTPHRSPLLTRELMDEFEFLERNVNRDRLLKHFFPLMKIRQIDIRARELLLNSNILEFNQHPFLC